MPDKQKEILTNAEDRENSPSLRSEINTLLLPVWEMCNKDKDAFLEKVKDK